MKMLRKSIPYLLLLSLLFPLLVGCTNHLADHVKEEYPLESINGKGTQTSYIYRAAGESVSEVAAALSNKRKPEQTSKASDERMFLVYSDEIIHIQKDPTHPEDSLIEIDSKEYVQKNYNPGFLEGYLLSSLIHNLFQGKSGGDYRGYTSKETYKPTGTYHTPTREDKKKHPPLTVDRIGSITKRSKYADSKRMRNWKSYDKSHVGSYKYTKPRTWSGSGRIIRRR